MSNLALLATNDTTLNAVATTVFQNEGWNKIRASTQGEAISKAVKYLPQVALIDFELKHGSVDVIKRICDYYGLETRVVLLTPPEKLVVSKSLGNAGVSSVIKKPISKQKVRSLLREAPTNPGFNGEHRVTFISADGSKEYQTKHGVAKYVESHDCPVVTVIDGHIPDWFRKNDHVVVGRDGELIDAFQMNGTRSIKNAHSNLGGELHLLYQMD